MARKKRRSKIRRDWSRVTQAEAEAHRQQWENASPEENRALSMGERLDRCLLMMQWGRRFGWAGPPRTLDDYRNDPWVRLRQICLERGIHLARHVKKN